jgi:outer membrane lipoprotein LolB
MTMKTLAVALAATVALAGCASIGPQSTASVGPYRDNVELSGRLTVQYTHDGKPESLSGKFNWKQQGANTDVALASPFGSTIATIAVTPQQATLTEGGKAPRSAPDVDSLSAQILGWTLPVSGLRDWLQGYAVAADGQRFVASPAASSVTTRDGWRLSYVSWQDGSMPPKPKRIDAERSSTGKVEEMALRIVIDAEEK